MPDKTHTFFWVISFFFLNPLLRTNPRFFTRSEPNQCWKILWRVNINNFIKKKWYLNLPSQRDAKTFERGRATFSKMPITPERNEIYSPNSELVCKSSIWGHRRTKISLSLATWWCCKREKNWNGYNCATIHPINMKIRVHGLGPKCHTGLLGHLCISKNIGAPLPYEVSTPIRQG